MTCFMLIILATLFILHSGGISLKPSLNMDKMRADMGGAACVVGTILGAASLKLKINIRGR